jgi:hypothetical protein
LTFVEIDHRLPEPERFNGLASLPEGKPVFVYPGPDDVAITTLLKGSGFAPQGDVCGAALFLKPKAGS